uniref:Mediator of RNA polymerase II transcription subunit 6 n=1 Tax=Heterorhabditis bacteriophora TaxID=37862 RepID=A0A1I7XPP5_HETBA
MSLLQLSTRQPDLLDNSEESALTQNFVQVPNATTKELEAPRNIASAIPHELMSENSRLRTKIADYVNAQRMLSGNAHAEQLLITMTGIQYVLWSAQPPLYVICKHRRNSSQNVTPLAYYYVINGTVYQAPDLHTFVQSRLLGAVEPLKSAFDQVIQFSRYNVAKGYYWEFKEKPATNEDETQTEEEKPLQARSSHFQKTRTHMLMQNLFEQFPSSSALEIEEPLPDSNGEPDTANGVPASADNSVVQSTPAPAQPLAENEQTNVTGVMEPPAKRIKQER